MSPDPMTAGHCTGCQAPAERGPSGNWWHVRRQDSCHRMDARFEPGPPEHRQHTASPRDRQIRTPRRDR